MEGGGGWAVSSHYYGAVTWAASWHGANGSYIEMCGTCVICVTCAADHDTEGGVIGKCTATRVVMWVSSRDHLGHKAVMSQIRP